MQLFYTDLIIMFDKNYKISIDEVLFNPETLSFNKIKPIVHEAENKIIYLFDTFIYEATDYGSNETTFIDLNNILLAAKKLDNELKIGYQTIIEEELYGFQNEFNRIAQYLREGLRIIESNKLILNSNIDTLIDIGNLSTVNIFVLKNELINLKDLAFKHNIISSETKSYQTDNEIFCLSFIANEKNIIKKEFLNYIKDKFECSYIIPIEFMDDEQDGPSYYIKNSNFINEDLYIITYYEYKNESNNFKGGL